MDNPEIIIKKNKTKRIKPILEIIEEISPKNITLKSSSISSKGKRCKKGTKKYKPLGPGCFTQDDINNFRNNVKLTKNIKKQKKKTKKEIELVIIDEPEEIIEIPQKRIEIETPQKKKLSKRR